MLKRVVVGSLVAATSWYAFYRTTRWAAAWGVEPGEAGRWLPGDDHVPEASAIETRGITIEAPPERVWPWLVQMGYGRAGWYSYDRIDMKGSSADRIVPELQALAVGDTVPTDPGGGFVVRVLDPGRALVLAVDEEILARRRPEQRPGLDEAGLAASGRFLETTMPARFRASWAFVLEPLDGGRRTRLVERFRGWFGEGKGLPPVLGPMLGFGVFVMLRKQLLGIRDRAEAWAGEIPAAQFAPDPASNPRIDDQPTEAVPTVSMP